ncbi:hypothetical protein [Crassaminicella thermophila]|nr:hypothetical protein [Crassaminicella thermophila]
MENKEKKMEEYLVEDTEQQEMPQAYQGNVNYFGSGRFSDEYRF